MYLNVWESINEFLDKVKDFFIENSRNPFLWVTIVLLGLLIFEWVYRALSKK